MGSPADASSSRLRPTTSGYKRRGYKHKKKKRRDYDDAASRVTSDFTPSVSDSPARCDVNVTWTGSLPGGPLRDVIIGPSAATRPDRSENIFAVRICACACVVFHFLLQFFFCVYVKVYPIFFLHL